MAMPSQVLLVAFFSLLILASCQQDIQGCPPASQIVYSPFQKTSNLWCRDCWCWAGCVFLSADECRKQQFGATAFVMGLIPIILRDVAWPERRLVHITRELPDSVDVAVRALGVVPTLIGKAPETNHRGRNEGEDDEDMAETSGADGGTGMYERVKPLPLSRLRRLFIGCLLALLASYGALAAVEIFSKRSSIGCPYPVFALTWHLISLAPATVETLLTTHPTSAPTAPILTHQAHSRHDAGRQQVPQRHTRQARSATEIRQDGGVPASSQTWPMTLRDARLAHRQLTAQTDASVIQGRGKPWVVQFVWAVFYAAGGLIYTSIMAVTVIELLVWFLVTVAVAVASKLTAFFLCMMFEPRGGGG